MTSVRNLTALIPNNNLVCLCIHTGKLLQQDLHLVYTRVIDVKAKWYNLGLALGVTNSDLSTILRGKNNHDDNDYLREMLSFRLRLSTDLTWKDLIEALECQTVNRHDIASELRAAIRHDIASELRAAIRRL